MFWKLFKTVGIIGGKKQCRKNKHCFMLQSGSGSFQLVWIFYFPVFSFFSIPLSYDLLLRVRSKNGFSPVIAVSILFILLLQSIISISCYPMMAASTVQCACSHAFSESRVCSSSSSLLTPCPGQPAQRGYPDTRDARSTICPHCGCFQTHDPTSRRQLRFCSWASTRLPAPSLATAAAVHRKFVKTHPIPQTQQFQQSNIFLQKPVLLEISQPSSAESHYFWSAFVNIYCRVFLNDNSHRLGLSLIWQFENLTLSCASASWRNGEKLFVPFNTAAAVWLQDVLLSASWRGPCLTQPGCRTQGTAPGY